MGMYEKCPCRHCVAPKRHPGCHGSCEDKRIWDESIKDAKESIKKEQRASFSAYSLLVEGQQKTLKKHGKKGWK